METKFIIVLEDDSQISSHDMNWVQTKDHAHALAPHNMLKWKEYHLITQDGRDICVNFENGSFIINGQVIHVADEQGEPLTYLEDEQNFPVTEPWQILNGMRYFPVVGRRVSKGELGESTIYFAGWKRKQGKRTIEKMCLLYPNGQVVIV